MTLDLTFNEWLQLGSTLLLVAVTLCALIAVDKVRAQVAELRAAQIPADPPTAPIPVPTLGPVTDPGRHRHSSGARATRRARND